MSLRRPLNVLLLLIALFNAIAGVPLHEARHLQQDLARLVQVAADDGRSEDPAPADSKGEAGDLCAWCLSHALDPALAAPGAMPAALPAMAAAPPSPGATGFVPAPDRWRFAARDPPAVSG
ncbi:hypothetical protein AAFF27_17715 [Xylophilus sp. GW821-FHT01B05]